MEIAPSNPSHQATSKQPHRQHRSVIASWCTACRQLSSPPDTEAKQRDVTPTITPSPHHPRVVDPFALLDAALGPPRLANASPQIPAPESILARRRAAAS